MPRKSASQWDFGELFPTEPVRKVFSVSDLTTRIKGLLEKELGEVWVSGEITNLRAQSSGHMYFTLKDTGAQLSCVLFRGTQTPARSSLKDGTKVVLQGNLTVYEPRGQYQLVVRAVELQGIGALQAAFERLKQKLQAEGLFDPARKRAIPRFPRRLGIVTSPTGAALRDVLHVIQRRFAGLEILLAPCRVQGQGAESEIAASIQKLNRWSDTHPDQSVDVILVTRGGGSLEDLWAFNEEAVARAIFHSTIPVVSAVGHEIDFTIGDFVADLRAATPSAAAEILTADYVASREAVEDWALRLRRLALRAQGEAQDRLDQLGARLRRLHPRRWLEDRSQRIDDFALALARRTRDGLDSARQQAAAATARLQALKPARALAQSRLRLDRPAATLATAARRSLDRRREALAQLELRLRLLSPDRTLARGYSITLDEASGRIVRNAEGVAEGTRLLTRLSSGRLRSVVVPRLPEDSGAGHETT